MVDVRLKTRLALVTRCQRNEAVGRGMAQVGQQMAETETANEGTKRSEKTLCTSYRIVRTQTCEKINITAPTEYQFRNFRNSFCFVSFRLTNGMMFNYKRNSSYIEFKKCDNNNQ